MEASTGIEPVYTDLQSAASPLRQLAAGTFLCGVRRGIPKGWRDVQSDLAQVGALVNRCRRARAVAHRGETYAFRKDTRFMTDFKAARTAMVDCQIRPSDVTRFPIIQAMLTVPREQYLPSEAQAVAYMGEHVEIGSGRVCLDPRVLAKLIDTLAIQPDDLVLDVGAGLGYSTAIVASIAEAVVALEQDEALAAEAAATLSAQGVDNAVVETGPLVEGAPAHGPYDVIVLQGGVETLPQALVDQLRPDGRIAMIRMRGALGVAELGIKGANGITWRRSFDATAPILPGFAAEKAFVF